VRVLHTSDWHIGKRLERHDRMDEHRAVVAEVAEIADREGADLVLHSGDLFDRALPPVEALRVALDGLVGLAAGGERPVVVVAGNHDSPDLFEALAPFVAHFGIHMVGRIKPPDEGGVLAVETESGTALVACFPFLRQAQTVDFMERADAWYGKYADRIRLITERYATHLGELTGADDSAFLVAHFMVGGVKVRTGAPRGERELHIGEAYAATHHAVPTAVDYVAMGHIHAPQPVPGAPVPAQYAGSLLQLDFGEAGEEKRVVVVDTSPEAAAEVRSVPLKSGRRLVSVAGDWDDITQRDDLDDVFLDVTVRTDGPDPGLLERVRERFPLVVKVRADYERPDRDAPETAGRPLDAMYAEYHELEHGAEPSAELMALFRDVMEEVASAAP
jgi:exonuclease SbcD